MSLSKLCLFTILAVAVAVAAMQRPDVQAEEVDAPPPNLPSYHPAVAPDESRWDTGHAKTENASTFLLPVQSKNPEDLGAGKLLVASRSLADPNFAETVILLVRCDAEGVVGLILNQRTNIPVSRVLEQFEAAKERSDPVYLGGPVETPVVFALLRSTAKLDGAEQILSGVYLISTKTLFEKAISGQPDPSNFHVYLGYAGWSNDQLWNEVKLGSWFIFQADVQRVFDSEPDSLWRQMIQETELKLAGSEPAEAQSQASVQHGSLRRRARRCGDGWALRDGGDLLAEDEVVSEGESAICCTPADN
jgi:putative AlgH/UPF0301 family transcriptional regulator